MVCKFPKMGVNRRNINNTLEEAGAIGLLSNNWAGGFGANRIFSAGTKTFQILTCAWKTIQCYIEWLKVGLILKLRLLQPQKI